MNLENIFPCQRMSLVLIPNRYKSMKPFKMKKKMLYYIKLKVHIMLLALLIFSNIILNLTESHFI